MDTEKEPFMSSPSMEGEKVSKSLGWMEWLKGWMYVVYEFLFQRITASHLDNTMELPPLNHLRESPLSLTSPVDLVSKWDTVLVGKGIWFNGIDWSPDKDNRSKGGFSLGLSWEAGSCEVQIIDTESGVALGSNQRGELWIKGPIKMKGYLGDAEATGVTLTPDGWLKIGDVCYVNEEGYFYVVYRLKELFKYKGYQVGAAMLKNMKIQTSRC